jgi:hypothetical protein
MKPVATRLRLSFSTCQKNQNVKMNPLSPAKKKDDIALRPEGPLAAHHRERVADRNAENGERCHRLESV